MTRRLRAPHCQKDLVLYQPVAERCTKAERTVQKFCETLGPLEIGPGAVIAASITISFLSDYIS